ncbi:sedoheptulose 7-phosphate cyclase [Glycomyces buryatensis]|uniref:2-epi-5-epi-valiolone synthase n=2 Tax=Glycomyces buryatensis TaxID=2570927 RepID=A0A4S8QGF2_9ACTN|nr:sedoheptulose 7-phosphate cyclase [Glycomyces buryatensis]
MPNPPDYSWSVQAQQPVDYQVSMVQGLLDPSNSSLARACGADGVRKVRCLVVVDDVVDELYGDRFRDYFGAWNIEAAWQPAPGDETAKTLEQAVAITEAMSAMGILRRTEKVIAIGGGVVMDVVGLAASLYRRGIPYVRIPTTLIGQVDAGVGVKTGVNHGHHKNRLGSYCAPTTTLIDTEFLRTVEPRHINNGMAEIIKMALVKDADLFELLEIAMPVVDAGMMADRNPLSIEIIARAIAGMLSELEPNLWESVLERSVDYGHTFSPSLELRADPPLLHGEAVGVDMAICVALAHNRGMLSKEDTDRALRLMCAAGLPVTDAVFTAELVSEALRDAVKHRDGMQRIPLTTGIGSVRFVNDLTDDEIERGLDFVSQWAAEHREETA